MVRQECQHWVTAAHIPCGKPAIEYDKNLNWWLCAEHWDQWMNQIRAREFEGSAMRLK